MKLGWFASPIFAPGGGGDYSYTLKSILGDNLPTLNDTEKMLIYNSSDFFGLNHYGSGYAVAAKWAGWMSAYNSVTETGLKQVLPKFACRSPSRLPMGLTRVMARAKRSCLTFLPITGSRRDMAVLSTLGAQKVVELRAQSLRPTRDHCDGGWLGCAGALVR